MSDDSMMSVGEYVKRYKARLRVEDGDFYDGEAMSNWARGPREATHGDEINHPAHYIEGRAHEPWDVIEDWELDFHLGNVVEYIARAGRKGDELEDLRKAKAYLDRKIATLESEEGP